jgi:hypothetical protein
MIRLIASNGPARQPLVQLVELITEGWTCA